MTACIHNGIHTEKTAVNLMAVFHFWQVFKKSLSCEYNRSDRKFIVTKLTFSFRIDIIHIPLKVWRLVYETMYGFRKSAP